MRLLIAFLVVTFAIGGVSNRPRPLRPGIFLGVTIVVAALFYSQRLL